jgi:hypothetical protein
MADGGGCDGGKAEEKEGATAVVSAPSTTFGSVIVDDESPLRHSNPVYHVDEEEHRQPQQHTAAPLSDNDLTTVVAVVGAHRENGHQFPVVVSPLPTPPPSHDTAAAIGSPAAMNEVEEATHHQQQGEEAGETEVDEDEELIIEEEIHTTGGDDVPPSPAAAAAAGGGTVEERSVTMDDIEGLLLLLLFELFVDKIQTSLSLVSFQAVFINFIFF